MDRSPCIRWVAAGSEYDVNRYLETLRRHKVGLVLPIIIALVMSTWYATSRPHKYEASMTLWFDTQAPGASSLTNPGNTTPAAQGMAVLQEFLGTDQFLVNVGHRSSLATYVANHAGKSGSSGVISKLTSVLHKSSSSGAAQPNVQAVNAGIVATLQKAFTVTTTGPQMVLVTMRSSDPSYIAGTLNGVAAEYINEIGQELNSRNAASGTYFASQLAAAQQSLNNANQAVLAYQASHPGALAITDAKLNSLTQTAFQDQTAYAALKNSYQSATVSVQSAEASSAFHVVDAPQGVATLSNKKHVIFTVVAGLMAGLVISLLALSGLTALDKTARRQEDLDGVGGMEVVATIRQLPRQRRLPGLRRTKSS